MQLVASVDLKYAGKDLKAGDSFEATESDAFILKGVGKASDDTGDGAVTAETEIVDGKAMQPTGRGRYKRRDMRSAD
jgi:hypothetical protein